jgi:hypothetical protein
MSFTIFLALNSAEFCNKYLRAVPSPQGLLPLSTYIQVWALLFLVVTLYLAFAKNEKPIFYGMTSSSSSSSAAPAAGAARDDFFSAANRGKSSELMVDHGEKDKQTRERERQRHAQKEARMAAGSSSTIVVHEDGDDSDDDDDGHQRRHHNNNNTNSKMDDAHAENSFNDDDDYDDEEDVTIRMVFWKIWKLVNLPNMRTLLLLMLVYKLGFMAADTVSALKLIEKGFKKEDLALFVLIEFPFQIFFAVLAGKWASGSAPLTSVPLPHSLEAPLASA